MEVIRPGYEYKLHTMDAEDEGVTVRFVEKVDGKVVHGISNEEVVSMLLHRFYFLQKEKSFSRENIIIIDLLTHIKELLRQRLARKLEYVTKKQSKDDGKAEDKYQGKRG